MQSKQTKAWSNDVTSLKECFQCNHGALNSMPEPHKGVRALHAYNASTQKVGTGGSELPDHPQIHSKILWHQSERKRQIVTDR